MSKYRKLVHPRIDYLPNHQVRVGERERGRGLKKELLKDGERGREGDSERERVE